MKSGSFKIAVGRLTTLAQNNERQRHGLKTLSICRNSYSTSRVDAVAE